MSAAGLREQAFAATMPWDPPSAREWELGRHDEREKDLWMAYESASRDLEWSEHFAGTCGHLDLHWEDVCVKDRMKRDRAYERLSAHRDIPVVLACFERMRKTSCAGGTHPVVLPTACAIEILRFLYPNRVKH